MRSTSAAARFYGTLGAGAAACENRGLPSSIHACPCCGYRTFNEPASFEICHVCGWQDDGQDDVQAHLDIGGPNRGSLWAARTNVLKLGRAWAVQTARIRPPAADEPRVRQWFLLDDVAVERIPSSDVTPWGILHDGEVIGLERHGDRVSVVIDIPYLRTRFEKPGRGFRLELLACADVEYTPYDEEPISSFEEIVRREPSIVNTEHEGEWVVVWGSAGVLKLRYESLALRFDDGEPLALAALDACAQAYWDQWQAGHAAAKPNDEQ